MQGLVATQDLMSQKQGEGGGTVFHLLVNLVTKDHATKVRLCVCVFSLSLCMLEHYVVKVCCVLVRCFFVVLSCRLICVCYLECLVF